MLISIIITNYNYGKFLVAAIESALAQTYENVEVIVVDDGSTDNSRDIIKSFGDRVISIFKQNGGQGSAFNAGFNSSRGEMVLFLDSDDVLYPDAIAQSIRAWKRGMSKLHFPLQAIDEDGNRLGESFPKAQLAVGDVLPMLLSEGDYCTPPTTGNVFSREFLCSVMPIPEEEWRDSSDTYIVQTAPFYGEIGRVTATLGEYRLHSSSLTANVKNGHVRIDTLHLHLKAGLRKQRLLDHFSKLHGVTIGPHVVTDTLQYFKVRLISLRISPQNHPFKGDRLFPTLLNLMRLTVRNRKARFLTKLAYLIWAPFVAALPASLSEKLAIVALSPYSGSKIRAAIVRP